MVKSALLGVMMSFLYTLDLVGTFAFAVSGALAGVYKKMDLYGVAVLGMVTAVGGGTLRDMLIGKTPPFIFTDYNYLGLAIMASLLVFYFHRLIEKGQRLLLVMDALGLSTFTVIGISVGLEYNIGYPGAVLLGIMTATAGGMVRDLLRQQIPLVLTREIYASACLIGGLFFCVLDMSGFHHVAKLIVAGTAVFLIRCFAIYKNWQLPQAGR
jgi:uncharacterized membrane protein YeiH